MSDEHGRRRYDSARRDQAAEQTRVAIAHAARALFLARGWAATTVRDVAEQAGVSVPTVYSAYGGKAGLAMALADAADSSAGEGGMRALALLGETDPRAQLAAMVRYDRRLFEHSGDLIRLAREAGRVEPELASAYRERRQLADRMRTEVIAAWPSGALRDGISVTDAVDLYGALCNIDVYTTLVEERGWSPDRVERWWSGAVPRELLSDGGA